MREREIDRKGEGFLSKMGWSVLHFLGHMGVPSLLGLHNSCAPTLLHGASTAFLQVCDEDEVRAR